MITPTELAAAPEDDMRKQQTTNDDTHGQCVEELWDNLSAKATEVPSLSPGQDCLGILLPFLILMLC